MLNPARGDIYLANLEPVKGTETEGTSRPVLIVQNNSITKNFLTIIGIPFTKNLDRSKLPSTVLIKKDTTNRLAVDSVLLCHQIRTLDKSRLVKRLGQISEKQLTEVDEKLLFTLGIQL